MNRLAVIIVALLIGAAAPARAWCEATCLAPSAPSESATPHCPSHEPSSDRAAMAAADSADCPVVEAARPVPSKLELNLSIAAAVPHAGLAKPEHHRPPAPPRSRTSTLFERCSPLRI